MKEEIKQKVSVIISATNTSGNEKRDAILLLFNEYISKDKVMEIAEKAYHESVLHKSYQTDQCWIEFQHQIKKEYNL